MKENISAALFIYQRWDTNAVIASLTDEKKLGTLHYLSDLLKNDIYCGFLLTGIGNIYLINFSNYANNDSQAEELIDKIDAIYRDAEKYEDFLVHGVSCRFGPKLLAYKKYELALEWGLKSHNESLKILQDYITDRESNTQQYVQYIINKCIANSELLTTVCDCMLGQPSKALERLEITYSLVQVITEKDEDVCSHALRCVTELLIYKDLEAVIGFYECLLENYSESTYSSVFAGNMACYLFEKLQISSTQTEDEVSNLKERISFLFNKCSSNQITTASYADHLNFLLQTLQLEEFDKLWEKVIDPNVEKSGVTEFTQLEKHTVEKYLQKELENFYIIRFHSWMYCVFLNTCRQLQQGVEFDISMLEAQCRELDDSGSWRLVGYVHLMKNNKEAAKECFTLAIARDENFKWLLSYVCDSNL